MTFLFLNSTAEATPDKISFQSRIYKPDGSPLEASNVQFKFSLMNPLSTCVLYSETFSNIDMTGTSGSIVLALGGGTRSYPVAGGMAWFDAFNNATSSYTCQSSGTYSPALIDVRRMVMQFNDGTGWQTLPPMDINSVPYAMFAQSAETVPVTGIMQGGASIGQVLKWNGTSWAASTDDTAVSGGGISAVSSANNYITVTNGASTPLITLNIGTAVDTVAAGNDSRIVGAFQTATALSGDLTGTLPNPTIAAGAVDNAKISDVAFSKLTGKPTTVSGYGITDGLTTASIFSGDVTGTQNALVLNAIGMGGAGSKITYDTKGRVIASANLNSGDITAALGFTPTISQWVTNVSNDISYTGGLVGIGTAVPTYPFHMVNNSGGIVARVESNPAGQNQQVTMSVVNKNTTAPASSNIDLAMVTAGHEYGIAYGGTTNGGTSLLALGENYVGLYGIARESVVDASLGSSGLHINNRGQGDTRFSVNSAERMRIARSTGNVGIGTTNPVANLQTSTVSTSYFRGIMSSQHNSDIQGPLFIGRKSRGTEAAPLGVLTSDFILGLQGSGYTSGGAYTNPASVLLMKATEDWTAVAQGYKVSLYTNPNGSAASGVERLTIDQNGNVGVSAPYPTAKLQVGVAPSANAAYPLFALGSGAFDGSTAGFFTGSSNGTFVGINAAAGYTGDFANFQIGGVTKFKIDNSGNITAGGTTTSTGAMTTSGNISTTGVGTITSAGQLSANSGAASTSPTSGALVVAGGAGISGALNVGSNIIANGNISAASGSAATVGANQNSPSIYLTANYWNGLASAVDQWSIQNILGAGANPTSTLQFAHTGSAGAAQYAFMNGNVGIGTTTPGEKLHVVGKAEFESSQVAGINEVIKLVDSANVLVDRGVKAGFYVANGVGSSRLGAEISAANEASLTSSYLTFNTEATGVVSEKVRITGSGNVGIGTTTPQAALQLTGLGNAPKGLLNLNSTSSAERGTLAKFGPYAFANTDAPGSLYWNWGARFDGEANQWVRTYTSANNYLPYLKLSTSNRFSIGGTVSNASSDATPVLADKFVVDTSTGYVGVGISAPETSLNVSGTAVASKGVLKIQDSGNYAFATFYNGDGTYVGYVGSSGDSAMRVGTAASRPLLLNPVGGNVGIGTAAPATKLQIGTAPVATAMYPLFAMGTASFDGTTSGFYTGSASGTFMGINAGTGYAGDFLNFQVNGVSKFKVDSSGNMTSSATSSLNVGGTFGLGSSSYSWAKSVYITNADIVGGKKVLVTFPAGIQNTEIYVSTARGATDYNHSAQAKFNLIITKGGQVAFVTTPEMNDNITDYAWYFDSSTGTAYLRFAQTSNSYTYNIRGNSSLSALPTAIVDGGAAPAFAVVTPIYSLGTGFTGEFNITTNGSKRMTVNASGDVGIGTITPQRKLDVNGAAVVRATAAGDALWSLSSPSVAGQGGMIFTQNAPESVISTNSGYKIYTTNTGGVGGAFYLGYLGNLTAPDTVTNRLAIISNGNVGLGTSTPAQKLDILGASIATGTQTNISAYVNSGLRFVGTAANAQDAITYQSGTGGGGAAIAFKRGGGWDTGIDFYTNGTAGNATGSISNLAMSLDAYGNLGVGTMNPGNSAVKSFNRVIDVISSADNSAVGYSLRIPEGTNNRRAGFFLDDSTGIYGLDTTATTGVPDFVIQVAGTEKFRLTNAGKVGIGTNNPATKLDVNGQVQFVNANTQLLLRDTDEVSGEYAYIERNNAVLNLGTNNGTTSTVGLTVKNGDVGIGTTGPTAKLDVAGTINIASGAELTFGGGTVCTVAGCTSSSDERLKQNIKPLDLSLEKILSLSAVQYDWKDKAKYGEQHQIGFIAQDLEKVYPEVVYTDKNTGLKSVTYGQLVAPLLEAVKSLYKRIVNLEENVDRQVASVIESKADKKELEVLKAKSEKLEAENAALRNYLCSKDPSAPICK